MKTLTVDGGLVLKNELGGKNGKPGGVLKVSRQRADELRDMPDFPEPAITTAILGQEIWRVRDVERWNDARLARNAERIEQAKRDGARRRRSPRRRPKARA